MRPESLHTALLIAVMSLCTVLLRALPFLIWSGKRKTPPYILYLGRVLPPAIVGMLVVYCLKDVSVFTVPHGLPEFIAAAAVVFLQVLKRNSLLSILGGTVLYMVLLQLVF